MRDFTNVTSPERLHFGHSPGLDAWLLHFTTENGLEYGVDPQKNASPEQLRFMVVLGEEEFYSPCSDRMLGLLLNNWLDPELTSEYVSKWKTLVLLLRENVPDRETRRRILGLCRHKYRMVKASPIIIPSRLMKRFVTMFLTLSGQVDPYRERRQEANERAFRALKTERMERVLGECPETLPACESISSMRFELDMLELARLMSLSTRQAIWRDGEAPSPDEVRREVTQERSCFKELRDLFGSDQNRELRILFLPDTSGGLILDLLVIRALVRQGHKVIMAVKEGFHFLSPAFWDWDQDPVLAGQLRQARFLPEPRMSKNELLAELRAHSFLVISDGTREELNLYRTSVTFARAWKECDLVMAKGDSHRRRLLDTHTSFTRDILCYRRDDDGVFRLDYRPKPEHVHKFSESSLAAMARSIISEMRGAKERGKTVMFYSAVIGSIPGQTKIALEVLDTFVDYLRRRLDNVYIINPGEHFVEGMDADDLMYMWEMVQRSGLIDVWRFQTVEDIEKSFELMGRKVPPFWTGKDATYSTGCTKEMQIALDMQKRHPEMQIIGPSPDKFFRRREYGVGKFCDSAIDCE
ncbi:ARMT1-like domain-containing protein [Desulfohalovibrio reitneri]|uniref:ARMT1-like domain-containing protein n=1 Tax=Desulfohalovibrio reitneri TaxID=1307759 RepID=UPI0004A75164|nr:ARMT1-like domain-containing protein [Desulfohalovibrio reitneri]